MKFKNVALSSAAGLILCALPATANHLTSVTITPTCTGFTVSGTGMWLFVSTPQRTLEFSFTVNGTPVSGSIPFSPPPAPGAFYNNPPNPGATPPYPGQYTDSVSQTFTWTSFGVPQPNGLVTITGSADVGNDSAVPVWNPLPDTSNVPLPLNASTTLSCSTTPNIGLTKSASATTPVSEFAPVTYTYIVTNTGGGTLTNVTITDDNGANNLPTAAPPTGQTYLPPNYTYHGADVTIANVPSLGPGQSAQFMATLIPAVTLCGTTSTKKLSPAGTLIVQQPTTGTYAGDTVITYLQSFALNDNTYGTNTDAGWGGPGKHKFNDLVGSDQAEIKVVNGGTTVWDGEIDYIANTPSITFPGGGTATYPSGWGTAGDNQKIKDSDGKFLGGTDSNLIFASTTLTDSLNFPGNSGFTTNSPVLPHAGWDPIDGYFAVIKGSFTLSPGSITIPEVHNSPSKTSEIKNPVYCPMPSTNTATVTATTPTGGTLTATAQSTVQLK
jgi:trimeric autotransporter adhesin